MNHFILYRLYGPDGELLYIGITESPTESIRAKFYTKLWYNRIKKVVKDDNYKSREQLRAARRDAIRAELPLYNQRQIPKTRKSNIV